MGTRTLKNVDALRYLDPTHLILFESNAFGNSGPYGGQITLATLDGERIAGLKTLVAGLNDPSSGLILDDRIWYVESKYGLLLAHPNDDASVPRALLCRLGAVARVNPPIVEQCAHHTDDMIHSHAPPRRG